MADSISLITSDPSFGNAVTFNVAVDKYDCVGNARCARVEVRAYQDGSLVYAETGDLGQARGDGTSPLGYNGFLLGGAMSIWLQNGGGPANCEAILYRFGKEKGNQVYIELARTSFTTI
jgi:hypothetical protein